MYFPFRHDPNYKESSLNNSTPTLLDSGSAGGRPLTSFSAQSGSTPVFHHGGSIQGLHNVQGSYNMQTPNVLSSRNSGMATASSSGVHQPSGNLSAGRFAGNNLPISLSQLSQVGLQLHNTMSSRANVNLSGSHPLSNGMNGSSVSGALGTVSLSSRGSLPAGMGMSLSQMGNPGTRIPTSVSTIAGGGSATGNHNRNLNAGGGMSVPSLGGSRSNMGPVNSSGGLGAQGQGRPMSPMLQQAVNLSSSAYSSSGDLMAMISSRTNAGQISGNGQLSNASISNDGGSNDGIAFDINDFPLLSNRPTSAGLQGPVAAFRKQGINITSIGQQNQEFSIQNEDFPALPGFKGGTADISPELHHKERPHENALNSLQQQHFTLGRSAGFPLNASFLSHRQQQQHHHQLSSGGSAIASGSLTLADLSESSHLHTISTDVFHPQSLSASYNSQVHAANPGTSTIAAVGLRTGGPTVVPSGLSSYDQLIHQYDQHQQAHFRVGAHQQQHLGTGSQPSRELGLRGMQDTQVSADRFGLLGLLSVIRMTDADLTTLALGTDLTTLGLNLNSRENLYKTFASPWADGPVKGEPEYTLPQCYMLKIPPELQPGNFAKFQQDTLFYIFYSMPNDLAQLYAASELCKRGWFYHKVHQMWLTRVPNTDPLVKTTTYERGSYYIFDLNTWETGRKENFVLQYEHLEKSPQLPSDLQQS